MIRSRNLWSAAIAVAVMANLLGVEFAAPVHAQQQQQAARPEIGKILQAAQASLKAGKYSDAMNKLREADAFKDKNAYENDLIDRMQASAALGMGDADLAARNFEPLFSKMGANDKLKVMEAIAGLYFRNKNYDKAEDWARRYLREGGSNSAMYQLVINSLYLAGNYSAVAKEVGAQIAAIEKAGRTPAEDQIVLLANAYQQMKDDGGYAGALEKLLLYYPKKEYWSGLLGRIMRKPGFSDRLGLDVYRLQLATGNLNTGDEYFEMAQLALQAGLPGEAKAVLDAGYAAGKLGVGAEAGRHQRLKDLTLKQLAEDKKTLPQSETEVATARDGIGLVNVGYTYATAGDTDKGIKLMEQGIEKGRLKRPDDALLHLGQVYLKAGDKKKAIETWRKVKGNDGTGDLARLWIVHAKQQS